MSLTELGHDREYQVIGQNEESFGERRVERLSGYRGLRFMEIIRIVRRLRLFGPDDSGYRTPW